MIKIKKVQVHIQLLLITTLMCSINLNGQSYWDKVNDRESTLGLDQGYEDFKTSNFTLKLVRASQTVAGLSPTGEQFDFTPGERIEIRDKDSLYHLGDINLTLKKGQGNWESYSSAYQRKAVTPLKVSGTILAASDMSNTFPIRMPVKVKRYYQEDQGDLVLRYVISNISTENVEIGALGVPMIFNNILEGKSLDQAHADNVFFDPYIGMDAGYLEVKHLNGEGKVLLVIPEKNMPFEAYRPLLDDPTPRSIVFEGFHEWMSMSKSYAQNQWKGVQQWNPPTSMILKPGEEKEFALKFTLANDLRSISDRLSDHKMAVGVGIPGYVLPMDVKGSLFLKSHTAIESITVTPAGALTIKENKKLKNGFKKYDVTANKWGRARISIVYKDGKQQTIHYKCIKSEQDVVKDMGEFLTTEQWFDQKDDPFNRAPSVISYDYQAKRQQTQDSRVWIAGLSDEGGAGSWLAAMMKQYVQPDQGQVDKLTSFVHETLWGGIQYDTGKNKYGVKKSVFYYQPDSLPKNTYNDSINYNTWAAWDHKHANDPGRSYNYPHVTAAYWVQYRLARFHDNMIDKQSWEWYLKQSYHTAIAMTELAPYYAQFGQMEGTIFLELLLDLKREGLDTMATTLEAAMKKRADLWKSLNYPFGSEMPWDSTGQEEVFMWSDYFGYDQKADVTLNAILAYMPTMPHWAYNGNARRYWDFLYGGKLSRIERQIHHYGSALNAIPVLKAYQNSPDDLYLLRIGYGGRLGGIANITQDGFAPAAFHSFPSTLEIDYLSGDYGSGFFGYAVNSAAYLTHSSTFGWLAFGGNITKEGRKVEMILTTASKNQVFISAERLLVTLDAGSIHSVVYDTKRHVVKLYLSPGNEFTSHAYLRTNKDIKLDFMEEKGSYKIPLGKDKIEIEIAL
ncbi:DUF5695 domain-containing protein [Galbibacter sp.]|uniref:DUF5695 domain-containing protein n=1 Tax=Galbibacter sp. TaxID=2918471 RepID=UPI002C096B33|nr:DUF5695 domain-containing protein [Galbibacter sp.]HLV62772.1 DUF5695 domain-containing protein [Galbibacter sp.]